jgi:hypothetical protein
MDVATNLVFINHQPNLTAGNTITSKHLFESFAAEFGVKIQEYLSDNHPFRAAEFVTDCQNQHQRQSLSGVGAHHQNRVERCIQTIFSWARAMMLHFVMHWPQQAQLSLWPFAVSYAVWLWNNLPDTGTRISPIELFTSTTLPDYRHLQRARVFGCPVFVLDPKLQDTKKLPKWKQRAWKGIFLGFSTNHSSNVALVLNPESGNITPQYHVIFDEKFSSVTSTQASDLDDEIWETLFKIGYDRNIAIDHDSDDEPTSTWQLPPDVDYSMFRDAGIRPAASVPVEVAQPGESNEAEVEVAHPDESSDTATSIFIENTTLAPTSSPEPSPTVPNDEANGILLRSGRHLRLPQPNLSKQVSFTHGANLAKVRGEQLNHQRLSTLNWEGFRDICANGTYGSFMTEVQKNTSKDGHLEEWNPALLATKANTEDLPSWEAAMNGPQAAGFLKACEIEIDTLQQKDCWEVTDRPTHRPVVSSTWAFRVKRFPDGAMRKLKARFCARGFEQTPGIDFHETYAPVVNWTTVRFLLIMSILLNLSTRQVDYVAAFVQSDIDTEVYVEMPRGFSQPGKVLKLKKSLYGLKQSPRNHFLNLSSKLEDMGFRASDADPCLFVSKKVIVLIYVDDTLLYSRESTDIDAVVTGLRQRGMDLEEEEDVAGFLGVHIDRRPDGTIHLTQKGLTQRIIDSLTIGHLPPKRTPSTLGVLAADSEGDLPNSTYSYASVIGMLGYLQANTRPDIAFAVAQCARFTHAPRRIHAEALERIGCYLKATHDKGLILKPIPFDDVLRTEIFVDADFAGGWGYENPKDPACVRSRTGFIIMVMGCPVQWVSTLQTDIATSTMEAEYSALSMALRSAIPLMDCFRIRRRILGK